MKCIPILLIGVFAAVQPIGANVAVTVSGEVTDVEGKPVADAVITFSSEANSARNYSGLTGVDGTYRIGLQAVTAVEWDPTSPLPTAFHLFPNYPNPFNPSTLIPYQVGATAQVRLRVFNLLGQPIRTLVDRLHSPGAQVVEWDGRSDSQVGVGAGLYVVRMEAEGFIQTRKMVLLDGAGGPVPSGRPREKVSAFQAQDRVLYTVDITADGIEPFSTNGLSINADTTLDFQVVRLPTPAIVVAAGGDINAALEGTEPGDLVILSTGVYTGQTVELKEGVTLRGSGPSRTILTGGFLRASNISGAAVENVTVSNAAGDAAPAISIFAAAVTLRNCHIEENRTFCAIQVAGSDAQATIQECLITSNDGIGVWVKEGAWAQLNHNIIEGNGWGVGQGAVLLSDVGTQVVMRDNIIRGNSAAGLVVERGAYGEIVDNSFVANAMGTTLHQIEIRDTDTNPMVRGNTVIGRGIGVRRGAAGQFIENVIEADEIDIALAITGPGTNPVIRDNTVRGSMWIGEQAASQVIGNVIGGRQTGIEISSAGTDPTIRDNILSGAGEGSVGINVGVGTTGQIFANAIAGYGTGIQLVGTPGRGSDIRDNILSDNVRDRHQSNPYLVWKGRSKRGMRDLKAGQFAQALETFQLALAATPSLPLQLQSRYYVGITLMRMERYDQAIPVLKEVLDLEPQNLKARWNLRISYRHLGKDPDALEDGYRLDLAPTIPPAHEPVRFTDVGPEAGVALVNMGRGTAWRDWDNDGWLDLLAVEDGEPHALFRNQGDGTFAEIAAEAGLDDPRGGWSALWMDYDNDGAADLFVTRDGFSGQGNNTLYHNEGDGQFADVTQRAGLENITDSFCAAWGDYDGDSWLDLYVGNGILQRGAPNTLYHNNRDGTFTERAEEAGVDGGRATIGVVWGDYDNDGWLDLYSVNNGGENVLYHNNGDRTFTDATAIAGVPGPLFGFVAFFLDYDNDGWLDLFVSNSALYVAEVIESAMSGETAVFAENRTFLYRNNGDGTFTDVALQAGLGRTLGTMAATYGDIDNDGYQDLYLANGGPAMDRFEPDHLSLNNRDGTFAEVSEAAGFNVSGKGHGTTMADYDNDGDLDIYSPQGGVGGNLGNAQPNRLYRNEGSSNHWLIIQLVGKARADASSLPMSNRDGVGAKVTVEVGGAIRYAEVSGGSGFGVINSLPVEFGLGTARRVEAVEIRWPSGYVDRVTDVLADQILTIAEGMTAEE